MAGRIYRIGIEIMAHNHTGAGLAPVIASMMHLHGLVNQTNAKLWQMKTALGGVAAAWVGTHILKDMGHVVDHGAKFVGIQNQMVAAGWKQHEVAEATAKAWQLSAKYQSVGAEAILEMQKEMAPVLGDKHEAMHIAETMTKLNVALLGTLGAKSAASFNKQIMDAIRTNELAGNSLEPARFEMMLDNMAKTLKAFGGTITPHDYFMATKYGRASAINWSDQFTGAILPTIMQELGASSTGTALMTMYQAIVAGRMKRSALEQWDVLGLIDHSKLNPHDVTPEGRVKHLQPGAFANARAFMENPFEWMWSTVLPAMVAHGKVSAEGIEAIKRGELKSGQGREARRQVTEFLATLFGDRTAQGMADVLLLQWKKIMRDMKLREGAMGMTEGAQFFGEKDYAVAKIAFGKQWENLQQALGGPAVDSAVRGLHALNSGLSVMSQVFADNPNLALGLVTFGATLAGLVTIAGSLALAFVVFGALPFGGIIAGLVGVTSALAALGAVAWANWPKIKSWWAGLKDWALGHDEHMDANGGMHARKKNVLARAFDEFGRLNAIAVQKVGEVATWLGNQIATIPGRVMAIAGDVGAKIGAWLGAQIAGITSWIGGKLGIGGGGGGAAGATGGVQKQSFTPPASGGRMIQASTTINVDGRRIAQAVTYHQVQSATHVGYDAGFDGLRHPTPIDYSQA